MGKKRTIKMLEEEVRDLTAYIEGDIELPKWVVDVPEFIDCCYERRAQIIDQISAMKQASVWHTVAKVGIPALATIAAAIGGAVITSNANKQIAISNQLHRENMARMGFMFEREGNIMISSTGRQVTQIPKS